ncbi:TRAP transporter large permease [Petroclostridium sp. X23]|uniref:TRAP transporter large permease n=1 Tax=Petroclostridium sp. X23 TaxID=3045146 RepID=UPI0024AE1A68|nr:TRAP transporter large permease [Petroclostridium sp. X23]WHH60900.1 TRAP transporter large permease [Petroclostridium sp. X23]
MLTVAFITFLIFLFLGVPIAFAMGTAALLGVGLMSDVSLTLISQKLFVGVDSFSLMAIPFFMLSGELMETGGISRRLVDFSHSLVGHIKGGLGMVSILTSIIFAGVSGSAAADTAAVGSILIPAMKKKGYPAGMAAMLQASAGSLGPIIPPSLTMIIYATLTGVSIGSLFLAGIIPGLIIGIGLMLVTYYYGAKFNLMGDRRASWKEVLKATKEASLALVMPLIIIGGIILGVFTATEAGAIAVLYAFIVGFFVYKEYTWKQLPEILLKAAASTSMAMLIIAAASTMGWIIAFEKFPQIVVGFVTSITQSPTLVMMLVIVFLIFVGMFIETLSATIIVAPILMPLAAKFGFDPIHFSLVMVVTLVYAGVTPPVGGILFITMGIARTKLKELLRFLPSYVGIMLIVLLIVALVPQFSLFIPNMIFK